MSHDICIFYFNLKPYRHARNGTPVEKPPRNVRIESIRLTDVALPEVRFEVACSAGTYIRSLCADIGRTLGCGGHLSRLVRTESSGFSLAEAVDLQDLQEARTISDVSRFVIPMTDALAGMPVYAADPLLLEKIRYGRPVAVDDLKLPPAAQAAGRLRVVDPYNRLMAVLERKKEKNADKDVYSYCCVFHYP